MIIATEDKASLNIKNMIEKERRFTSNAAHELKTPLAAIKIQTEVAKLSLDDKDSLIKSLNNIEMGVDKSTRMIEQLLALSRLESISNFENLTNINWIEIINSTIKEVEFNAKQKDISIDFLYDEDIKTIKGEPFILSLLIRNLLDNAIKYNEKGTKIEIKLEKNNLFIQDNGKGLDSKILKNIGERFLRPAGQKQIGSGLGFSIIMQIAKLHNLNVNFENINPNGFKINILLIILCFNSIIKLKQRKKMKKSILVTSLFFVTTSLFAQNLNQSQIQRGGFVGPTITKSTIEKAKTYKDDMPVAIEGYIVEHLGKDKYLFRDSTGDITIEIDNENWNGMQISPKDKVTIHGEVDKDWMSIEIDVDSITKE